MKNPFRHNSVPSGGPLGPDGVEVHPRCLRIGDTFATTLAVTGYPRQVRPGWLEPLLGYVGAVDVSLFIEPMQAAVATDRLRRQLARLESSRRSDADHGRLADPSIEVAAFDAQSLASRLARGEAKLFRTGIVICVRAESEVQLAHETKALQALLGSLLVDAKPTTFRMLAGWKATLPFGIDTIGSTRTFDTNALAVTFPFASSQPPANNGMLYGTAAQGPGLVTWDRFAQRNFNSVILAQSGAGKSYFAKLEILRSLYRGVDVLIVDPEDEYRKLSDAVGGTYLHLGEAGVRINPFDLGVEADALTRRCLFLHTFLGVLLNNDIDDEAKAALDGAIIATYARVGITSDPRTHGRRAPVLADLVAVLDADENAVARSLGSRLRPFSSGSFRGLFNGVTTTQPVGHLVVFSLRDLPDELKPAASVIVLDHIWRTVSDPTIPKRRFVAVDEAWMLMRDPVGAKFLFRLAKSARKYHCGLTVITQDAADLLSDELGQAVVANSATQILLGQAPQAIDALASAFRLTEGERTFLLSADRGEGILIGGKTNRIAFKATASATEHDIAVSLEEVGASGDRL